MKDLQAFIYKLVNSSVFNVICSHQWSQIQTADAC